MNAKHTPGPWSFKPLNDPSSKTTFSVRGESNHIAKVSGALGTAEVRESINEANARLIAAAPELLATLQAVVEAIENSEAGWNGLSIWQEDVHAVIAKATGE